MRVWAWGVVLTVLLVAARAVAEEPAENAAPGQSLVDKLAGKSAVDSEAQSGAASKDVQGDPADAQASSEEAGAPLSLEEVVAQFDDEQPNLEDPTTAAEALRDDDKEELYFSLKCLSCMLDLTESDDYYSYAPISVDDDELVAANNELQKYWRVCDELASAQDCHVDDRYTASIEFEASYGLFYDNRISNPKVTVVDGTSVDPEVVFDPERDHFYSNIIVKYNCKPSSDEINIMEMSFTLGEDQHMTFRWLKVCGGGPFDMIQVAHVATDPTSEWEKLQLLPAKEGDAKITVPADDPSTTVEIRLLSPARTHPYLAPVVIADDTQVLNISTRGDGSLDWVATQRGVQFEVNYSCKAVGSTAIEMRVGMPPFDPVVRRWRKECGIPAGHSGDSNGNATDAAGGIVIPKDSAKVEPLDVGTEAGQANVIRAGVVAESYKVEVEGSSLRLMGADMYEVSDNSTAADFYVTNPAKSTDKQVIDKVSLTIERREVVHATIIAPYYWATALRKEGGSIEPGQSSVLTVRFICKRAGDAAVLVTLASLYQENVEFGFKKRCNAPRKIVESTLLRTAGSIFRLCLAAAALVIVFAVYTLRKRTAKGGRPGRP